MNQEMVLFCAHVGFVLSNLTTVDTLIKTATKQFVFFYFSQFLICPFAIIFISHLIDFSLSVFILELYTCSLIKFMYSDFQIQNRLCILC